MRSAVGGERADEEDYTERLVQIFGGGLSFFTRPASGQKYFPGLCEQ